MTSPFRNVLLGTAVGDSLGLPAEGLSARRIARRWPGPWRQRLVFGRGMVSDDTEHTVFVAQCLAEAGGDAEIFQRKLAWRLRFWLLGLPAGVGLATAQAIGKLWMGFPPSRSGVYSAGNGPAMRSAILGVYFAEDAPSLIKFIKASTRLTHTDPKAEVAALAVAATAAWTVRCAESPKDHLADIRELWTSLGTVTPEWKVMLKMLFLCHDHGDSVADFARKIGLERGVTGYAFHTVPVALYAWLTHFGDFRASVEAVVNCGGDTDTTAAITGALAAIRSPIPPDWVDTIRDHPISPAYLRALGDALETKTRPPAFVWPLVPLRNLFFLGVVMLHGLRRLVPD